jgi:beta-RFAP synthase
VLARLELPAAWRFLLVLDHSDRGLHGAAELAAFRRLPVFPAQTAARLCHLVLMKGLPAAMEDDITAFGDVITELQTAVGEHFAPAQGGLFASRDVAEAIDWLGSAGAVGLGQSSWGPTGFCLADSPERAEALLAGVSARFGDRPGLQFLIGTPRHRGAEVVVEPLAAS